MRDRGVFIDIAAPLALVGGTWAVRHTFLFGKLVSEDRVFEWMQVGLLVLALGLLASAAVSAAGPARVALAAGAATVFVALGEEVAWGTRYFKTTVDVIAEHNGQGDVTLHNLPGGLSASIIGIAVLSLCLAAMVLWRRSWVPGAPDALVAWLLVPAAYCVLRLGVDVFREPGYWLAKLSEAVEVVFTGAIARLSWAARAGALQRRPMNGATETNTAPAATTSSPASMPAIPDTVPTTVGPKTIPT